VNDTPKTIATRQRTLSDPTSNVSRETFDGERNHQTMNEQITFTVPGKPVAKGRARSTRSGRHYTPERTRVAESTVLANWFLQVGIDREPHAGPFTIEIVSTFEAPKSWSKAKRAAAIRGEIPHTTKPDADNLLKLIKDALINAAYRDDSQAFHVGARKQYGETAATTVNLNFYPTTEYQQRPQRKDNN
jgi:Holliday junction resolvase RusA-like endonuclease